MDTEYNSTTWAELFEELGHPVRIKILQCLGEAQLSFSELKRKVGLESSGHLQFHLGKLDGLVRILGGDYALTDDGREALRLMETLKRAKGMDVKRSDKGVRTLFKVALLVALVMSAAAAFTYHENSLLLEIEGLRAALQASKAQVQRLQGEIQNETEMDQYAENEMRKTIQDLQNRLGVYVGLESATLRYPQGLPLLRASPQNQSEQQAAVLLMQPNSRAVIYVEYDVNSYGYTILNIEGSVSRYEECHSIFEWSFSEDISITNYPQYVNIIKGNVTVAYTIDVKSGSKGTYFISFGSLAIVGLVGQDPSKLYPHVLDFYPYDNSLASELGLKARVVAIEGAQVIYVRYIPVQW
jgi:DNA-binding transcriptional ArsR family regulator